MLTEPISLADLGLFLVILGIIIIIIGFIKLGRGGRGGGILLIGPIPIIWGTDRESLKWVVLIGLLVFIVYIIFVLYLAGMDVGGYL